MQKKKKKKISNFYLKVFEKAGQPPKFKTEKELHKKIVEYFKEVKEDKEAKITITGLALFLGFESRQSFYDYEDKKKFSYTIKRARSIIEQYYEHSLMSINCTGAIFALKNFGWKDKSVIEQTVTTFDVKTRDEKG